METTLLVPPADDAVHLLVFIKLPKFTFSALILVSEFFDFSELVISAELCSLVFFLESYEELVLPQLLVWQRLISRSWLLAFLVSSTPRSLVVLQIWRVVSISWASWLDKVDLEKAAVALLAVVLGLEERNSRLGLRFPLPYILVLPAGSSFRVSLCFLGHD